MAKNQPHFLKCGDLDNQRLQILANAHMPYTCRFLDHLSWDKVKRVADLGCRTGLATFELAKRVGTDGVVYAVNLSAERLQVIEDRAHQLGIRNIQLVQADFASPQAALPSELDLVYCRFFLPYLKQPLAGLEKMQGLLNAGGMIAVEELSVPSWTSFPRHPAYDKHIDLFMAMGKCNHLDFAIGPQLYAFFRQLQLCIETIEIAQPVFRTTAEKQHMVLLTQELSEEYLKQGFIDKPALQELLATLQQLAADDDFLMLGGQTVQILGHRRDEPAN